MRFYISECTFCFWMYFQCGSEWLSLAILLPHLPVCWEHSVHHPPCQALNISYCHESLFFRVWLKSQVIHLKLQQTDSVCSLVFPIKGGRAILALPSVVILQTSRYTDYLINFLKFICVLCLHVYMFTMCVPSAHGIKKRGSELEFQVVASHHVGVGNWTLCHFSLSFFDAGNQTHLPLPLDFWD